ncbi:MAG: hypothetical protein R3B93_09705 [Bacteroidia bacterium]
MIDQQHIRQKTWLFLREELPEAELTDFLAEIERDEAVADIVMTEIVRHSGRINLMEKLQQIHATQQATSKTNYWPWISVAASIIVLFLSIIYWQSTNSHDIYQQYFEAYRAPMLVRGMDNSQTFQLWEEAIMAYQEGDYEKSIHILEKLVAKENNPQHKFYLALSYMAISPPQTDKAIPVLEEVHYLKNEMYEQTSWYLALAYWKNKQLEDAYKMFNLIAGNQGSFHQQDAQEILALWE